MSEINDLRERVEAAEQRFGLIDEQQRHYSARVIGLIETIEAQLAAARGEIEKQIAENLRLAQDNEELRRMLHSVLRSIEEKTFTSTLQDLESRVSALVASTGAAMGTAPATAQPVTMPIAGDSEEIAPADAVIEAEGPAADEDAMIFEAAGNEPEAEIAEEADVGEPATTEEEAFDGAGFDDVAEEEIAAELDDAPADEAEPAEEAAADPETADEHAEEPAAAEEDPAAAGEEEDLFAAMSEMNAEDPAFAEAAAGSDEPEAEADAEPEAEAETDVEAAEVSEVQSAAAEAVAPNNHAEEAAEGMAPTVKEIIRRVGDLARELERAETARRAALDSAEPAEAHDEDGGAAAAPPVHQAANG